MLKNRYHSVQFLTSAAQLKQLPHDSGIEIAFAGRSNAGKSTLLNCLTQQKRLAKTSKTPGRTQLINLFSIDPARRLVDLPGYGFAQVPQDVKERWQRTLALYLEKRQCLKGVILLMDSRHPLQPLDMHLIDFLLNRRLPIHMVLTKIDKLTNNQAKATELKVQNTFKDETDLISIQTFSSLTKKGFPELVQQMDQWFAWK